MRKLSYSIGEVAAILGVSGKTLRRWEKEGKVRFQRTFGRHRRMSAEEVERVKAAGASPDRREAEKPGTPARSAESSGPKKKPRFSRRRRLLRRPGAAGGSRPGQGLPHQPRGVGSKPSHEREKGGEVLDSREAGEPELPPSPRQAPSSSKAELREVGNQVRALVIDLYVEQGVRHVERLVQDIDESARVPASLKLKIRALIRERLAHLAHPNTPWSIPDPVEELAEAEAEQFLDELRAGAVEESETDNEVDEDEEELDQDVDDLAVMGLNYAQDRLAEESGIEDSDEGWEDIINYLWHELCHRLAGDESPREIRELVDDLFEALEQQ